MAPSTDTHAQAHTASSKHPSAVAAPQAHTAAAPYSGTSTQAQQQRPAVAPAPKLSSSALQWHKHPSSQAHTTAGPCSGTSTQARTQPYWNSSGTVRRHQHPSSKTLPILEERTPIAHAIKSLKYGCSRRRKPVLQLLLGVAMPLIIYPHCLWAAEVKNNQLEI